MSARGPAVLRIRADLADAEALRPAVEWIRAGRVLVYPTETVYGIGSLCVPEAVDRVHALKRRGEGRGTGSGEGREPPKPLLAVVPSVASVEALEWTPAARELAEVFWPGALTLVLSDPRSTFPPGVRAADGGVAVRVSPHPTVRALVEALSAPLTSTSANRPGESPARSGEDALAVARALGAGPEVLVVDAGALPPSPPSTIVDCRSAEPVVLRAGSLPIGRLRCVLPEIHESDPT